LNLRPQREETSWSQTLTTGPPPRWFLFSVFLLKSSLSSTIYITRGKEIKFHHGKKKKREKSKRRHVLDYGVFCMDEAALVGEISAVLFDENNHIFKGFKLRNSSYILFGFKKTLPFLFFLVQVNLSNKSISNINYKLFS
jgi:hypothetical protein